MGTTTRLATDWEFEERLAKIALPRRADPNSHGMTAPAAVSLTLLMIGVVFALLFFLLGFVLLFFCIGILVWYVGAAVVALITGAGAVFGIVAIAVNPRRPAQQMIGILGFVLNAVVAALCGVLLSSLIH